MTRLVVIGLDGGTDAVIGLADANLPNIAALRRDGISCRLTSTVPPITSSAWASMLTGWNPGRHGMYDFRQIDARRPAGLWTPGHSEHFSDSPEYVTSARWRGAAVWDLIDGARARVSSVPMTYPAWTIDGEMIAGFPLPDYGRNHSTPAGAAADRPPLLEHADRMASMSDRELSDVCRVMVERQANLLAEWIEADDAEFVMAVFQATDFAQHRLWRYLATPGHPLRTALLDLYRSIDRAIGDARSAVGESGTVVVVSDHGFGPHPTTLLRMDAVLARAGLLATDGSPGGGAPAGRLAALPRLRRRLRRVAGRLPASTQNWLAGQYTGARSIDWRSTRAFRYPLYAPADGVVVNLRGRQPHGIVDPGAEYEQTRDAIIQALAGLRDSSGEPVVEWARRREQVYSGSHLEQAPDVIALFRPGYKPTAGPAPEFAPVPAAILERYSGVHAMTGIFAAAGAGCARGLDLGTREIVDVAPTLLALFGQAAPEGCDGRAMSEGLTAAPTAPTTAAAPAEAGSAVYTDEEQATMERSLRALGYLE